MYGTTRYFREQVLRKRTHLQVGWCIAVIENYVRRDSQADGRVRYWRYIPELGDRALRVVTLEEDVTIHNAFPDRNFHPEEPTR
jgi:hypothetical protein